MKSHRIRAFLLRHTYPLRRDFDLLSDMIYWPIVDLLLWGITSQWLYESSGIPGLVASMLSGLVLWNVIWRAQSEVSRNLMDEIWNNNLVNLFSTPLTLVEWILGVLFLSIIKTSITMTLLVPLVILLYKVNFLTLGVWIPVFMILAGITGWWIGFISAGIVLRYGPKVQTVIWTLPGILLPFSAIYFPLDRLPEWVQMISRILPTTYIFEAMRGLYSTGTINPFYLVISLILNLVYLSAALAYFVRSFTYSKNLGLGRFE